MTSEKETEQETKIEDEEFKEILKALEIIQGKTREEAIAKAIEDLSSDPKLLYFTDVEKREIPNLSVMKVIAKRYKVDWLDDYVNYDLNLRVSNKRQGRKEHVKVIAGVKKAMEERFKWFRREKKEEEIE